MIASHQPGTVSGQRVSFSPLDGLRRLPRILVSGLISVLVLTLLSGCNARPLDASPPERYDLSGKWLLLADLSDPAPDPRRFRTEPPPLPRSDGRPSSRRQRGGGLAFVAHDFPVLNARRMNIEQSSDSMGVDYDRGAYRDVSWGERERGLWDVSTGWNEAGDLEIRWRASDASAVETYRLSVDGQQLQVQVNLKAGNDDLDVTRVFTRARL